MIFTENSYYYPDIGLRGQNSAAVKSGRNDRANGEKDFYKNISEASERAAGKYSGRGSETEEASGNVSAQEEYSKNQGTVSELIGDAAKAGGKLSRDDLLKIISGHREEILRKLKNGETGVKIPIGSLCLTEEEWKKLLDSFDEAQEKIQENTREKSGEELPEKRPDTTVNGDKVLAPEDTGHDLKSLEELVNEADMLGISGKPDEQEEAEAERIVENLTSD